MVKSTDGGQYSAKQGRSLSLDGWPVCKSAYRRLENLHSTESQGQPKGQRAACEATWMPAGQQSQAEGLPQCDVWTCTLYNPMAR